MEPQEFNYCYETKKKCKKRTNCLGIVTAILAILFSATIGILIGAALAGTIIAALAAVIVLAIALGVLLISAIILLICKKPKGGCCC